MPAAADVQRAGAGGAGKPVAPGTGVGGHLHVAGGHAGTSVHRLPPDGEGVLGDRIRQVHDPCARRRRVRGRGWRRRHGGSGQDVGGEQVEAPADGPVELGRRLRVKVELRSRGPHGVGVDLVLPDRSLRHEQLVQGLRRSPQPLEHRVGIVEAEGDHDPRPGREESRREVVNAPHGDVRGRVRIARFAAPGRVAGVVQDDDRVRGEADLGGDVLLAVVLDGRGRAARHGVQPHPVVAVRHECRAAGGWEAVPVAQVDEYVRALRFRHNRGPGRVRMEHAANVGAVRFGDPGHPLAIGQIRGGQAVCGADHHDDLGAHGIGGTRGAGPREQRSGDEPEQGYGDDGVERLRPDLHLSLSVRGAERPQLA